MAKLSNEDKKEIVRLRNEGVTMVKIGAIFHIHKDSVKRIYRQYKLFGNEALECKKHKRRYFSYEDKIEIVDCIIKDHQSQSTVSILYNIHQSLIKKWVQQYKENGYNGLVTKKLGRTKMKQEENIIKVEDNNNVPSSLSDEERKELIELRRKYKKSEIENAYLKKLDALVQERIKQQRKKKSK